MPAQSSARTAPPDALSRLMAMRNAMGITRVGDLTGLDRIGVPVIQVVRPFSLANAVSQGKGLTVAAAAISALMECAETFCAESVERFAKTEARASTIEQAETMFGHRVPDHASGRWADEPLAWVEAVNISQGGRAWVPFELVHTAYVHPLPASEGIFLPTTTGLAAGFNRSDAILHGLLECIERDAVAQAKRTHGFYQRFRIDETSVDNGDAKALLERLRTAGMLVGLWHAPSRCGVPVVWCHLLEDGPPEKLLLEHPADGSAAALDLPAAMIGAMLEAAQGRLAAISGAREDLTRNAYASRADRSLLSAHRRLLDEGPRPIDFRTLVWTPAGAASEPLPFLVDGLQRSGVGDVLAIDIDAKPLDLAVVKIVVPALVDDTE